MAIKVELAQEEVKVEPGGSAQVVAIIRNAGEQPDQVALEIEGLDTEWCAIPVPSVNLDPGAESRERILIRPPRSSESRAGVYPFIVRARSLENEGAGIAQASLIISPFNLLTLDINPKRNASGFFRKEAFYDITISNLGNTELNLQLFASEPEEGCAFEFETERVHLTPGESRTLWLKVQPVQAPLLGSPRLYGFTVSARAIENPYVAATVQGQLERRSLVSPTLLWGMTLLLLMGVILWRIWPRPVMIEEFKIEPAQITAGEKARLSWRVSNAKTVIIEPLGKIDIKQIDYGTVEVQPQTTTTYRLVAENNWGKQDKVLTLIVNQLPEPPMPVIESFTAEPKEVMRGESVLLKWRVKNAVELTLFPLNAKLDPAIPGYGYEHKPDRSTDYVLIAKNSAGKFVEKMVRVKVVEPSQAQIVLFAPDLNEVNPGMPARLRWEVKGAAKVEIDQGIGEVDPMSGEIIVTPQATTTYTLTATDADGRPTKQSVTIKVKSESTPSPSNHPGNP